MKRQNLLKWLSIFFFAVPMLFILIFPFLVMVSTSFKTLQEVSQIPPTFIPRQPTLENYRDVWDIIPLAKYYLDFFRSESRSPVSRFGRTAISALYNHDWPGNVRELINRVRRAIIMSDHAIIEASDMKRVLARMPSHATALIPRGIGSRARTTPAAVATPFPPRNRTNTENTWPTTAARPITSGSEG